MKGVEEPLEICEVGEAGKARLRQPPDSEKAHRFIFADREPVLGWRPAIDQPVPGTGWVLERKLGEGGFGEVWLGRDKRLKTERVFKYCFRVDRVRSRTSWPSRASILMSRPPSKSAECLRLFSGRSGIRLFERDTIVLIYGARTFLGEVGVDSLIHLRARSGALSIVSR